jgi:hypothetical protein
MRSGFGSRGAAQEQQCERTMIGASNAEHALSVQPPGPTYVRCVNTQEKQYLGVLLQADEASTEPDGAKVRAL